MQAPHHRKQFVQLVGRVAGGQPWRDDSTSSVVLRLEASPKRNPRAGLGELASRLEHLFSRPLLPYEII